MENLNKIALLDANHPLMKRFQEAFRVHLLKQLDFVNSEIKDNELRSKAQTKEKETMGENLYKMQQELIKQQTKMAKLQEEYRSRVDQRTDQTSWEDIRDNYRLVLDLWNQETRKEAQLQEEVDALSNNFIHLLAIETEAYSEASLNKLVAKQARKAKDELRLENAKQNACIEGLMYEIQRANGKTDFYRNQYATQENETKELLRELMHARAELEIVGMEKQKIVQQWRSSLNALERRNDVDFTLKNAFRNEKTKLLSIKTEMRGLRQSIKEKMVSNEKLIEFVNRQKMEVGNVTKTIEDHVSQQETLEREHAMFEEVVLRSRQDLKDIKREIKTEERNFQGLMKEIDLVHENNNALDDEITKKLTEKSTLGKVTQNRNEKLIKTKMENQKKKRELNKLDDKISQLTMDIDGASSRANMLKEIRETQDREIRKKEAAISRIKSETEKRYREADQKQNAISQMKNKLNELINAAGGEEYDPLEREIKSAREECDETDAECIKLQKQWLKLQGDLISSKNQLTTQQTEVDTLNRESIVLEAKQHRMEKKLEQMQKSAQNVENECQKLKSQIDLQNAQLEKERGLQEGLKQQTEIQKLDLVGLLKETEIACLEKEEKLENIRQEAKLIQQLQQVTAEEVSLWEKKIELLEETKKALNSAQFSSEIHSLKTDIHHKNVHLSRLKKEEELVIQKMEKVLTLRDTLLTKVDLAMQSNKRSDAKVNLQNRIASLEKKVKTLRKDLALCEQRHKNLEADKLELGRRNEADAQHMNSIDAEINSQEELINSLNRNKHKNMLLLSLKQQKSKYYSSLKENRYSMKVKNKVETIPNEVHKVQEEIEKSCEICRKLAEEYPHLDQVFLRLAACSDCIAEL